MKKKFDVFHTANIYSQVTSIGCVTFSTVVWMQLSHAMAVYMKGNDSDECIYWISTPFYCYSHWQTTVANVTLPKAVRSTIEIFAVYFTTSSTTKTYVCAVNLRVITMVEFQIEVVLAYLHMICDRGLPKVLFWVKAEAEGSKNLKHIEFFLQKRRSL